uniref:Serine/threonine-protein kinase RIO1 n=1 Tax=Mucochytrium quahogii TaxID=96639 RepID=A0A7S2WJR9_9STRA|mmetsp:Transcript_18038/g.29256  ORF Transcript_18038/g.29256 Transcript_18038/m.29256 type:complete len:482 (+) Transcript_18038:130-1575(+)|eukprot:CAMPEP_0203752742 /NCGR_PEP_ID=MMETSP0098-20131031/6607_1 /ASSEMBLY_ACC=CAM_ASM_000208 /TAXON_ID=96639 /ORGANISM=" , Strain NY0313808BC1" /LENGTH=481 /DNA_ID=CAMNT_0050643035 /DNA_START=119 /DNA_END=1564 /DNA_ORIENTATION=+
MSWLDTCGDDFDVDYDDIDSYDELYRSQDGASKSGGGALQPREHEMNKSLGKRVNLSQRATNDVKRGEKKQAGQNRIQGRDDRATTEQVMDPRTRLILFKMLSRGTFEEINGCISTGKEANVYHAATKDGLDLAVKVFKTSILVFKDRDKYVSGEHRFRNGYARGNPRKMVKLWAEKEMRNLKRLHVANIPCPEPRMLRMHVLLMDFIGKNGWPAPRLKDAQLSSTKYRSAYVQCLKILRRMFQSCRLVHGDFSEYNLLWMDGTVYVIDVSQSVEMDHPRALEFLRMDCQNTNAFFKKKGLNPMTLTQTFQFIVDTSFDCSDEAMEAAIDRIQEELENDAARVGDDDALNAEQEVQERVFLQSFIPTSLSQVCDVEKQMQRDEGKPAGDGKYFHIITGMNDLRKEDADTDDESQEDTEEQEEAEQEEPEEVAFTLKNADKESRKAHKQRIKELNKEKRKDKTPKHVKKRNKKVANTNSKKR